MKRWIGLLLVAVLTMTMSFGVFAAPALADVDTAAFQSALTANGNASGLITFRGKSIKANKLDDLEVKPGDELKIYLTTNMFIDKDGKNMVTGYTGATNTTVTRAQIRAAKITLRRSASKGTKAYDSFGIKYDKKGAAYISFKFADPYVSLKETEFSSTLTLYVNGKRRNESKITISGEIENESIDAYSDTDYLDISDGTVVEAEERVPRIELDLGNDVTVTTSLVKGRKYYGVCTTDISSADDSMMSAYPGIINVYTMNTLNIKPTGKAVYLSGDKSLYVYNAEGVYLDTANKMLPMSTKYYLSEKKYDSLTVR